VRLVGRSFKYHRPRGVLTAGSEEPNALVEVMGKTNQTPTSAPPCRRCSTGWTTRSQNRMASLRFDLLAVNDLCRAVLSQRRLLLQDLHVAARLLGKALRAADPPGRGAGQPVGPHDEVPMKRPLPSAICW
jgi:hypothetical protein